MNAAFWKIHSGLPREGPGDNKSTRKAYMMLEDLPENPRILDVGCGPGMQTIELAKLSGEQIVALDVHEPFLEQLKEAVKKEGANDMVKPINTTTMCRAHSGSRRQNGKQSWPFVVITRKKAIGG